MSDQRKPLTVTQYRERATGLMHEVCDELGERGRWRKEKTPGQRDWTKWFDLEPEPKDLS